MNPPFLFLHGALGCSAQFDQLLQLLPPAWRVLTFDFPGHAGRPAVTPCSVPRFAESVIQFLDQEKIEQVQIFGYSMGGYVALHLAWKHPERVQRIFTLGTKLDWTPATAAKETARLDPDKIAEKVPAFAQLLAERHAPADWQTVVRRTAELLHRLGNGDALGPQAFGAIACPVLIGLGGEDNMVTPDESQAVAALLPRGAFEMLPGIKHPFEQVEETQVAQWLIRAAKSLPHR